MAEDSDKYRQINLPGQLPIPDFKIPSVEPDPSSVTSARKSFKERIGALQAESDKNFHISDKPLRQPSLGEKVLNSSDFRVAALVNGDIKEIPISKAVSSHMLNSASGFSKYSDKVRDAIENPAKYKLVNPKVSVMEDFLAYVELVEEEISKAREFAKDDKVVLDKIINDLGDASNTDISSRYSNEPIKGFTRSLAKAISDDEYNGDWTHIRDYARGALVYSNVSDVKNCIDLLKSPEYSQYYEKIHIKDSLTDPSFGEKHPVKYRDVNISIQLKSGRIVELQIHLDIIFEAQKNGRIMSGDSITIFDDDDLEYLQNRAADVKLFVPEGDKIIIKTHNIYEIRRAIESDHSIHSKKIMLKLMKLETSVNESAWQEYLTK